MVFLLPRTIEREKEKEKKVRWRCGGVLLAAATTDPNSTRRRLKEASPPPPPFLPLPLLLLPRSRLEVGGRWEEKRSRRRDVNLRWP